MLNIYVLQLMFDFILNQVLLFHSRIWVDNNMGGHRILRGAYSPNMQVMHVNNPNDFLNSEITSLKSIPLGTPSSVR